MEFQYGDAAKTGLEDNSASLVSLALVVHELSTEGRRAVRETEREREREKNSHDCRVTRFCTSLNNGQGTVSWVLGVTLSNSKARVVVIKSAILP